MIISPPFLSAAHPQQNDAMPTADAGNTVVPDGDVCTASMLECAPGNGAYPVSFNLGWHGGAHLRAPTEGGDALPVRAIADGRIVYVRKTDTTHKPTLQYRNVRTDDGCVVIRHDTEIGEGENAKITYYSVYLHLQQVMPTLAAGNRIYRKDVVGTPGQIFGQYPQIHFEIICSEANLKKMIGRAPAPLGDTPARRDAVYGDMWFFVPRGAKLFASEPHPFRDDDSAPPVATLQPQSPLVAASCDLVIRMHYEKDCTLTTYRQNADLSWSVYGAMPAERDAEYNLYKRATALNGRYTDSSLASPAAGIPVPSPSAIFEMIRFGRCINDQLPAGARFNHWRKVRTPDGDGWINLSKAGVRAYSDADFPEWAGWSFINDDPTPDSLCDSPTVKRWLDVNHAGHVSHADAVTALGTDAIRQRMARAICKFPSEWSRDGLESRYNWLKSPHEALTNPLADEAFTKLIDHARDLAFWEDVSDPDFPHANEVWHFPPTAFVRHFRACNWLEAKELAQCIPRNMLTLNGFQFVEGSHSWDDSLRSAHAWRRELNTAMRKYLISATAQRMTHFFAQLMEESGLLKYVREIHGEDRPYAPYYGRGLIQLTHEQNYDRYGKYRRFPVDTALPQEFSHLGWNPNVLLANTNQVFERANCADSAALYWTCEGMTAVGKNTLSTSDAGIGIADATLASKSTNGNVSNEKINGLDHRLQSFVFIKSILMDMIVNADFEALSFVWRRNSSQEPVLDASGQPVIDPHTHRPKKKFYPTTHNIQVSLIKQRP
ncbi:hydroxyethylthiazole kinase [Paraburkholderia caledonica]|uniref:Hydroxyethylthiazole kinase n=1 Tax=Paraburkholderia caledonica TaxID=134536 RepID=A0ABU1L5Q2_9BURK|nr:hydroxyethylthiazole kinase [Paraburkholderia caledonica]MDR6378457.1 hydroxyethylthiazole kinase [Paraburkholderia caledonica]